MADAPDSPACSNWGAPLHGPFCATCGQKAQALNPTFHDLLHHVIHEMLHVDGRIFQSVKHLLLTPGFLTAEQFAGRRARWISPLRLYLIFSVIDFAVASFAGMQVRVTGTDEETALELQRLGFRTEEELVAAVSESQAKWTPRVMFVLVPLFAWLVHVACRGIGRNYR